MIRTIVSFIQRVVQVVLVASVLVIPQSASANGWQDAYSAWSSGRLGDDMLNALGTSADDIVAVWENRGEFVAGMGEEITSGRAGERVTQFGGGLAQGAWEAVVETAALAWDGAAFLALGGISEAHEGGLLDQYEPASKLVSAYKHSEDPGATTLAILQGLAELPGEFVDAMWNDPAKAGRILGGFLVPMAGKGVSRLARGAGVARRAVAANRASNPCVATCAIVDDLSRVTKAPRGPPSLSAPITAIGRKISQKQLRHVKSRPEWVSRGQGSYLNSVDDAQAVLDSVHSGRATVLGTNRNGHVIVRVDDVTGFNNNPGAGFVDQPTNVFIIKGTAKPSVVPTNPNWTPAP